MEIFTLVLIAMSGVETSMVSIGGFLTGDEDVTGLRLMVHHALKVVGLLLLVLTLFILIVPQGVALAFGARGANVDTLSQALRIFSLSLVPIGIINVMRVVFQLLGHRFASGALFTSQMLFMDIVIGAIAFLIPTMAWWGFPVSSVLMLAMMFAYTLYHHHKDRDLSPYTLVPRHAPNTSLDFSVPYEPEALEEALTRIRTFVMSSPAVQVHTDDVLKTCEDIMKNIIEHAKGKILKWSFDVHLRFNDTQITFVIKDAGRPFIPLNQVPQSPSDAGNADSDDSESGIRLASSTCEELTYKHMWGQNMILGTFR